MNDRQPRRPLDPTLLADGFEDAFIGYIERCGQPRVAIYDRSRAINILLSRGLSVEDAEEYFSFNVEGAWAGTGTPGFFTPCALDEFHELEAR